jgi:hypothetical protein
MTHPTYSTPVFSDGVFSPSPFSWDPFRNPPPAESLRTPAEAARIEHTESEFLDDEDLACAGLMRADRRDLFREFAGESLAAALERAVGRPKTKKAKRPNRFRERELARAVRAAKSAGGERIEIDPTTGKISVILAKPGESTTDNEVEDWLSKQGRRADQR